jgi:hypothetical protein
MGFPRVRSAQPRFSVSMKRPEVPEPVRGRLPQRRGQRRWRRYVVGVLAALAIASIAAMVVRRRLGQGSDEVAAGEAAPEQPPVEPVATTGESVAAEATADPGGAGDANGEAVTEGESQRFSA